MTSMTETDLEIQRILDMTDDEIDKEIRSAGGDPVAIAKQGRETVKMAIAEFDAKREGRLIDTMDEWYDRIQH